MKKQPDKKIILEDGQEYYGYSFGSDTDKILEIVFNTSIVGYIAIQDLTRASDIIRTRTFDALFPLLIVTVIYFILAWLLGKGLDLIAKKEAVAKK